jgi:putative SOS response-associated peptidase YedK
MCARISLYSTGEVLAELFHLDAVPHLAPRYNIAPTQPVAVVRPGLDAGRAELTHLRWGLIPSWSKDPGMGQRLLNARAETVAEKPAFRTAFARRRCLIPVNGFYEWQTSEGKKLPLHFRRCDGLPFALAGLWERWLSPEGQAVETCAVLTTDANDLISPVHDRMPVIIAPENRALWLDPSLAGGSALHALLRPAPAEGWLAVPASPRVNSPRNEGPECLGLPGVGVPCQQLLPWA